jgi:hypothetical protein
MLSAIGIIIILKQIPHLFGYDREPEGTTDFVQRDGYNTVSELSHMLDFVAPGAALIGLLALAVVIAWEQPFLRRMAALRFVPGSLVAVLLLAWRLGHRARPLGRAADGFGRRQPPGVPDRTRLDPVGAQGSLDDRNHPRGGRLHRNPAVR